MQHLTNPSSFLNEVAQCHYTLFAPLTHNNGGYQPSQVFDWFGGALVKITGGFTCYPLGAGLWICPNTGIRYGDSIFPIHFVTTASPELEMQLAHLVADMARRFEQEEIFLFKQPVWVVQGTTWSERLPLPISVN